MPRKKMKDKQPDWMKKRIKQTDFLRSRGVCTVSLSYMTERDVQKAYDKEMKNAET